nr:MAG TPA: hypothetical protein [Bacteriophage sp.]
MSRRKFINIVNRMFFGKFQLKYCVFDFYYAII